MPTKQRRTTKPVKSMYYDEDLNNESIEVQNDEARSIVQTLLVMAGYQPNNNTHAYGKWSELEGELSF